MDTSTTRTAPARVDSVGDSKTLIMVGLALGIIGGIVGSIFETGSDGATLLYSLSAIGLVLAGPLLALRLFRSGADLAAAGFVAVTIVFTAGSVAGFSGEGSDAVLGSMSILHLPALALIAADGWAPVWSRAAAALSGLAFAVWGYTYTLGDEAPDSESPILIVAWVLFMVASAGWLLKVKDEA